MIMKISNHIVIPNSILARFSEKNNEVYFMDLLDYSIDSIFSRNIFTKKNYYIDDVDNYIKKNVETQIGLIYKKIKTNNDLSEKDLLAIKSIFFIQYFRNNEFTMHLFNFVTAYY